MTADSDPRRDASARPRLRTMEDLARAVGLSRPTVSKFFADPASVRQSTRARIERALEEFDYTPNLLAMNLNRRHPRMIGVVVPDILDPFFTSLIDAVQRHAMARGYLALSQSSHGDPALEERAMESLASANVAGIILAPLGLAWAQQRRERLTGRIPVVIADSQIDQEIPFVGTDNRASIGLMVDYLSRSGSPPAFFAMPRLNSNAHAREEAYSAAMRALGLEPRILNDPSARDSWDFEAYAREATLALLDTGDLGVGATVLCANDRLAFGVISAAFARGIAVGRGEARGLRVAGHDDHPLSRFACPPLTTVAQDVEAIGREALAMLLDIARVEEGEAAAGRERQLSGRLVLRASA
jgi:DNA-binding LacI/PurR family transcriptional regulator